jgi:hypothetical protein
VIFSINFRAHSAINDCDHSHERRWRIYNFSLQFQNRLRHKD